MQIKRFVMLIQTWNAHNQQTLTTPLLQTWNAHNQQTLTTPLLQIWNAHNQQTLTTPLLQTWNAHNQQTLTTPLLQIMSHNSILKTSNHVFLLYLYHLSILDYKHMCVYNKS